MYIELINYSQKRSCKNVNINTKSADKDWCTPGLKIHDCKKNNSIRDAHNPQPEEIIFNTMRYKNSVALERSGYFQSSVSYIKVQIMLK